MLKESTTKYDLVDYCYQDFNKNELYETDFIRSISKAKYPIVTIIHHTDLDGICAAQVLKEFCDRVLKVKKIDFVSYNYQKNFNFRDHIDPNSNYVIVVDLSLKYTDWHSIFFDCEAYRKGLWMDHHVGSIREVYGNENLFSDLPLEKFLDINGCGTAIAYHLTKAFYSDIKFVSFGKLFNDNAIRLVDVYDRWLEIDEKYFADCLNRYVYASDQLFVDSDIIRNILLEGPDNILNKALTDGNTFLQLEKERNRFRYEKFHKDLILHTPDGKEYKSCVVWGSGNSQLFGDHINDYDVVIRANKNDNGEYYFSFYTVKEGVDCCEIAKQYGGSGHLRAAGCMTNYNILK